MHLEKKHPSRMIVNNEGWQKSIRCRIILKTLIVIAALAVPLQSAKANDADRKNTPDKTAFLKHSSPGKVLPCVPPQISRMEKPSDTPKNSARAQRNAGNPSLSYAVALSMALGLRSVAGPVVQSNNVAAQAGEQHGQTALSNTAKPDRIALAPVEAVQCSGKLSMKLE